MLPAAVDGSDQVSASTPVAGLPLLRRIVLAAGRARYGKVLVGRGVSEAFPLLVGTSAEALTPRAPIPPRSPCRIVLLAASVIPQASWLRGLLDLPLEPDRLYIDGNSAAVIEVNDPQHVLAIASERGGLTEALAALRVEFAAVDGAFDEAGRFRLRAPSDTPAAEAWLRRGLMKPTEGFMSRHVERRISLGITRRLAGTRITPNAMTAVSLAIGLAGAPFFLSSVPAYQLTGALLFLVHSIVDGCDGELARLKFLESRFGASLDFWGDNLVHVAVFSCMAVGWSLESGARWPLILGAVVVASTVAAATVAARRATLAASGESTRSSLSRLADAVANRDFIYLVILLAAVGKANWFLLLAGVGTPIFLAVLLWSNRARRVS